MVRKEGRDEQRNAIAESQASQGIDSVSAGTKDCEPTAYCAS